MSGQKVVIFDGDCKLCNASVKFASERKGLESIRWRPYQSGEGRKLLSQIDVSDPQDSIVYCEGDNVFRGADAVIKIADEFRGFWKILAWGKWLPRRLRNYLYRWIARHRHFFFS